MLSLTARNLCAFAVALTFALTASASSASWPVSEPSFSDSEDATGNPESIRACHASHTDTTARVDALVERARDEDWSADKLFLHLELDDATGCLDFSDRTLLQERHASWSEAVALLDRVDPDALDAWLLGLQTPPQIAQRETRRQLRCLLRGLVDAIGQQSYDIRLFTNFDDHFEARFRSASELASAIDSHPSWMDRTARALTRSIFRDLHSQAYTWHRKFRFSGRGFNRISPKAAEKCGFHGERIWRPDSERHRRCWHGMLSPEQREREILSATAGPGLSRHHWGTDVDLLGLNPVLFQKGAILHDDWRWLDDHGLDYGFFQSYRDLDVDRYSHMEEPWHWSYYPIAQALWDFARHDPQRLERILFEQWDRLELVWGRGDGPYFDHLREHWQDYFFHIHIPSLYAQCPARDIPPGSVFP